MKKALDRQIKGLKFFGGESVTRTRDLRIMIPSL